MIGAVVSDRFPRRWIGLILPAIRALVVGLDRPRVRVPRRATDGREDLTASSVDHDHRPASGGGRADSVAFPSEQLPRSLRQPGIDGGLNVVTRVPP